MLLDIIKLRRENNKLKEELEQKDLIIQYLNACVNKANRRTIEIQKQLDRVTTVLVKKTEEEIDFPNSLVEAEGQISIHDILEN